MAEPLTLMPAAVGSPSRWPVLAYGCLGLPLAFAALPIYVHVPRLYAGSSEAALAAVGGVLLAVRLLDGFTDPVLGWLGDRFGRRRSSILLALPLLACGLFLLLNPPAGAGLGWMAGCLLLVTLAHSLAVIQHNAWGVALGGDTPGRARLVAAREGFGLVGVLLAALLAGAGDPDGATRMAIGGCVLLAICAPLCLSLPAPSTAFRGEVGRGPWAVFARRLQDRPFRRLLAVFALNGIAAAIPATTFLFFVEDVLQVPAWGGAFLALYFLSGALGLPVWLALSRRIGPVRSWLLAMLLAMLAFASVAGMSAAVPAAYALLCIATGLALGADLTLPQALLAEQLAARGDDVGGASFGLWTLVGKLNLALSAGLALPLLGWLGYVPGQGGDVAPLMLVYGGLPLLLKLLAALLLWHWRDQLQAEGRQS